MKTRRIGCWTRNEVFTGWGGGYVWWEGDEGKKVDVL